jgi:hypothetical protein
MYYKVNGTNMRIAGSMHVFPSDSPKIPDWILEAYDWCEHLVIESDPPSILPYLQLPAGSSLENRLPANVWRDLSARWPAGQPLAPLKPWVAMVRLLFFSIRPTIGVDVTLIERAKADGKPIGVLENGSEVARLFDTVPDSVYAEALAYMLHNPDFMGSYIRLLHAAWLGRDVAAFFSVVSESPLWKFPALREALVYTRNRAWTAIIRKSIPSSPKTLVLVGALHLCGENSLVELLELHDLAP